MAQHPTNTGPTSVFTGIEMTEVITMERGGGGYIHPKMYFYAQKMNTTRKASCCLNAVTVLQMPVNIQTTFDQRTICDSLLKRSMFSDA